MGKTHKTDPIDAKGLAILLRNGTLPEVWIPPAPLRDQRELLRTRMALRDLRTMLKHRIHSALERHGIFCTGISDLFGVKGREFLQAARAQLPPHTARRTRRACAGDRKANPRSDWAAANEAKLEGVPRVVKGVPVGGE